MKKLLAMFGILTLAATTITNAAVTVSIAELFQNASFGYDDKNAISVDSISTTMITLKSPVLLDYSLENVPLYVLTYSPYSMEDLADATSDEILNSTATKEVERAAGETSVTLTLGIVDGLDATKNYYAMVTPVEIYDALGTSSEQICFNLSEERYEIGDACLNFEKEHGSFVTTATDADTHSAASTVDMTLAGVSHTIDEDTINLKWVDQSNGSVSLEIFVFDTKIAKYVSVARVQMSDEKYSYTMTWDGEHIFRFVPLDGGREVVYNVQAMRVQEKDPSTPSTPNTPGTTTPVITNPPKTGPVENMIAVVILSVVGYFLYKRYAKSHS